VLKKVLIAIGVVVAGFAVYYGHFLFTKKVVDESMPTELTEEVKRGAFNEIDFIHKGKGTALLYNIPNGKKLLRFEDFEVTNGPDLYVYLSKKEDPKEDIEKGDFISLGRLKGTVGNQNYEIENLPEGYKTVIIWCKQFSVLFSFAVLQ